MEILHIIAYKIIRRHIGRYAPGEYRLAKLLAVNTCVTSQAFRKDFVMGRAGRTLEHDGIRNDGCGHKTGHLRRRHEPVLLIHGGNDRGG